MLLAHYKLNDNAADTTVLDSSGNGRHGTAARNTDLVSVAGKINTALSFNGTSDYVDCGSRFMPSGSFTLCGWFYLPTVNQYNALTQRGNSAGDFFLRVAQSETGTIRLLRWTGVSNGLRQWTSTGTISATTWTHVAAVYNAAAGEATIAINGAAESLTGTNITSTQSISNFRLGRTNIPHFVGSMDDVRVYDTALSLQRIKRIYRSGLGTERKRPWLPPARGMCNMQELVGGLTG